MRRAQPLLGTLVEIAADDASAQAMDAAFAAVARVHALMSFHEAGSDLARINREAATRPVPVHAWTYAVLRAALRLHDASAGRFDCTVARELTDWRLLPAPEDPDRQGVALTGRMSDVLLLGDGRVGFSRPLLLDLGGIAKGFAVDVAVHALRCAGVREACVNAGGDLRVLGRCARLIHVRAPDDPQRLLPLGQLAGGALATSGIYYSADRVDGREVSALVDGHRREPLLQARSYSVLAPSCMVADALTKVLAQTGDPHHPVLRRFGAAGIVL